MRVALVFDKVREDTLGVHFERACRMLGVPYAHFWTREAGAIPRGFELYLRIDHGDYRDDLPDWARPRIFYASDTHLPKSWKRISAVAKRYDLVCCAQRDGAQRLRNGVWVPHACQAELHGKRPLPKRWDVAFVGTEGGVPRKFYLQALRERYADSFIGHAPHTELGAIYSQAKIGFNYSIRDDVNMRMFEILCSGTLLLTNGLAHDDLARLGLREGEHLVTYRRPRELFELLDYYRDHDQEREAIARRGMERVVQEHTYVHRLQQILSLANERLGVCWSFAGPAAGVTREARQRIDTGARQL
ncbi:MAG: glycosyltransferase family 1 protein [Candidatus Omnitrophica bacterium]|nr:glycosyltransferase family 1 protein [Candidatus Omnitrophota bacterium]